MNFVGVSDLSTKIGKDFESIDKNYRARMAALGTQR